MATTVNNVIDLMTFSWEIKGERDNLTMPMREFRVFLSTAVSFMITISSPTHFKPKQYSVKFNQSIKENILPIH